MKSSFATVIVLCASVFTLPACTSAETDDSADEVYTEAWDEAYGGKQDSIRAGRFETFTGKDGKSYFHLLAGNGEKVLSSQGYTTKSSAERGIETVRFNGALPESYQLLQARDGQWYFNLLAGNWQVIATSELYVTRSNAERGLATVVGLVEAASQAAAARRATFQVFRGLDGQYYFHLRAGNGEIVLSSESYTRRSNAVAGTSSVRSHGTSVAGYQLREAANGQTYFVLIASNGQVIAVSETYATRSGAERAIATVAGLIATARIADAQ